MYEIPDLEVYLDLLFLLNAFVNYFIFWMVSKITYQKTTKKRLLLGSFVGAILYCLIVIIPFLRTINSAIYLLLLPIIPIRIIFNPTCIKQWVQTFVISNITALITGGMSFLVFYWIKQQSIISNSYPATYEKLPIWVLVISILASYLTIQVTRYYLQRRNTGIEKLYQLKIQYNEENIDVLGLLDTGNKVYDPITKQPVIIVEYKALKSLLPVGVQDTYAKNEQDVTYILEEASKYELGTRIRLIPYQSLGNPNGMLLGFRPDKVYIDSCSVENVIIAIYQHNLSAEGTYQALVHGDIIN